MSDEVVDKMKKKSYSKSLDRLGFFCDICGVEQPNEDHLVHFKSDESVQSINVCHNCLAEDFE